MATLVLMPRARCLKDREIVVPRPTLKVYMDDPGYIYIYIIKDPGYIYIYIIKQSGFC